MTDLDWPSFFEGYSVGTAQMVFIDAVILYVIWPARGLIALLKQPLLRGQMKLFLGLPLTEMEKAAVKAASVKHG